MTEKKVNETKKREPDCVTEVRFGKSVLVVKGYFKENGTKTAEDIMADVLKAEFEAGLLDEDE